MRLLLELFGRQLAVSFNRADQDDSDDENIGEHDNLAAQVERAPEFDGYDSDGFGFSPIRARVSQ